MSATASPESSRHEAPFERTHAVDGSGKPVRVSFIVPCLNESANVAAFFDEMSATFGRAGLVLELVFVDDGSQDATFEEIQKVAARASEGPTLVIGLSFSRNFGKDAAIWAGLMRATGDIVGIIDGDGQQPPKDALAMTQRLLASPTIDCVAAYQRHRRGGPAAPLHRAFYSMLSWLSDMDTVRDASDFRVFRRQMADAMLSMPESLRFTKGMFAWVGFETEPYPYTPRERRAGATKYSFKRLTSYALDGIFAFSIKPLRLTTILGLGVSILAIIYMVVIVIRALVVGIEVPGYVTTIGVVLLIGGIQLLMLGIIGEYLARIYLEGKRRPIYLLKREVESAPKEPWAQETLEEGSRRDSHGTHAKR